MKSLFIGYFMESKKKKQMWQVINSNYLDIHLSANVTQRLNKMD